MTSSTSQVDLRFLSVLQVLALGSEWMLEKCAKIEKLYQFFYMASIKICLVSLPVIN